MCPNLSFEFATFEFVVLLLPRASIVSIRLLSGSRINSNIKSKGEVDVAYVSENQIWLVEIECTRQLRPKQIKQIAKYPNGRILTRSNVNGEIQGVPTEPLPLALLRIEGL